jgi:DNA-binding MarR family transcriptional regulator
MAAPQLPFDPITEAARQWERHGWDQSVSGMSVVTSVMRVYQIFLGRADALLRPFGLTFARYELLMLLMFSSRGSMPMGKLSARLQVHPTSVTSAVDRLEAQGYVRRIPHTTDRRATLAEILPSGRSLAEAATLEMNKHFFEDPGLSTDEAAELFELLRKLRLHAGDFAAESSRP